VAGRLGGAEGTAGPCVPRRQGSPPAALSLRHPAAYRDDGQPATNPDARPHAASRRTRRAERARALGTHRSRRPLAHASGLARWQVEVGGGRTRVHGVVVGVQPIERRVREYRCHAAHVSAPAGQAGATAGARRVWQAARAWGAPRGMARIALARQSSFRRLMRAENSSGICQIPPRAVSTAPSPKRALATPATAASHVPPPPCCAPR